jgi:2,4-dienoyl-CoA reductase-like NADH-dependent reductase (Old Yellow Enzyme family)
MSAIFTPLTLPCGATLPNRLAKAAMEEQLAGPGQLPSDEQVRLYETWAKGGTGLLISGNVMVDPRAVTSAGCVVLQADTDIAPFTRWADAVHRHGAKLWLQISHPGRQVFAANGQPGWAPSAVSVDLGKHSKLMAQPRAMTEDEIRATIRRFGDTAQQAEKAGCDGVQIHGAHGYLISQFLSPLTNQRTDQWGGSLDNRARILREVVAEIRRRVAPGFAVSIKLNSADFQRGGFDADDARTVLQSLEGCGVDLVELSGGSYEAPAMQGQTRDGRTLAREAYFLEFAADLAKVASMPLMTTGGIRRREVAEQVVAQGVQIVGIGTALGMRADLPNVWRTGKDAEHLEPRVTLKDKTMNALATMAIVRRQLQRMGAGKLPVQNANAIFTIIRDQLRVKRLARRYKSWLAEQPIMQGK